MVTWLYEIKCELERIADCFEEQLKVQKKIIKDNKKLQKELMEKMRE